MLPFAPPKTVTLVNAVIETDNWGACVILIFVEVVHPKTSVTVICYKPAHKPVNVPTGPCVDTGLIV